METQFYLRYVCTGICRQVVKHASSTLESRAFSITLDLIHRGEEDIVINEIKFFYRIKFRKMLTQETAERSNSDY